MIKLKIIIPYYGDILQILPTLDNLTKYVDQKNIIIVNNNDENKNETIDIKFPQTDTIYNQKNLGYGGAVNIGIKSLKNSSYDYVLILNQNILFSSSPLDLLTYASTNDLDLLNPLILDENQKIWFDGGEIDKVRYSAGHKKDKLDYLSGCCMLIRKNVFDTIGLFDEKYFMYYEDVDFCIRARKKGLKMGIASTIKVEHNTRKSAITYKNMIYYLARNHILFMKNYASCKTQIFEYLRLPKTLYEHINKNEYDAIQGLIDGIIGKYGKRI